MGWPFADLRVFGYDLIVADPPWEFELYSDKGAKKSASAHYETMPLAEIKALPVGHLAGRDCLLLLWCCGWTMATGQAQEVARAWGFKPQSEIIWHKRSKHDKQHMGTGYRVRSMHEPVLLCTAGSPEHKAFPSVFAGRARENSRKPEEFYALVDKCAPRLRGRADLFARQRRDGWDGFGKELGKFDVDDAPVALTA